ncbi:MAG: outer membrane protein assembly factor BamD [Bacteroidetes bacterium SW_9_63_38]|nr:MAG: outer membrane protein assembly factor BamD [Bacteroidetes bacterium SW_9_63_38]
MRLSVFVSALSLVALVGLVGCSSGNKIDANSPKTAHKKGMTEYEEEDYKKAVEYFQTVFNYGRGNEWAPEAQFKLAMAQRERGKHLVAANEFKRFTQLYRNNARVPRAEFERAKSYYLRSPNYHLDQSDTKKAIERFQLFIDRYPDHKLVSEAKSKIDELRAKLAHKQYDAARLYERRDMWQAATQSYRSLFDQYPETPWADDALLGALRSYVEYADRSIQKKQAERYQKALDQYAQLKQLFPDSPLLEKAREYKSEAERKLERVQKQNQQSLAQETGDEGLEAEK